MRYSRLPHGASIHPQQRNKILVAQCQSWVRKRQKLTVGQTQHRICGQHQRQLESQLLDLHRDWVHQKMEAHQQRQANGMGWDGIPPTQLTARATEPGFQRGCY